MYCNVKLCALSSVPSKIISYTNRCCKGKYVETQTKKRKPLKQEKKKEKKGKKRESI